MITFIRFTARAFRKQLSIYVFSYFPFGFEGRVYQFLIIAYLFTLKFRIQKLEVLYYLSSE